MQAGTLACFFVADSNEFFSWKYTVPGIEYDTTIGDTVVFFAFVTGIHYNLENIIRSLMVAEDKKYALGCLVPYAQFFVMMFASSYSQLFTAYPVYFIIMCGFHLTWVTAIFNLCSTASSKFDWFFAEPIIYLATIFIDANKFVDAETAKVMYVFFFMKTLGRYAGLMRAIVMQITKHMGLRFLYVKEKAQVKQE